MQILNQEIVNNTYHPYIGWGILCFVLVFVFFVLTTKAFEKESYFLIPALILLVGDLFLVSIFFGTEATDGYYNKYEVIIDDTYSFKELYEKYDVIEQRGNVYVIQDKELTYDSTK